MERDTELIKRLCAPEASPDEFQLFLYTAERTGLDPLARQIYAVKRSGRMTIQTGIDGYRLIADRTGKLAGISDYLYDSEEGKAPGKATVTVKKVVEGAIAEFTASARWPEYNAGGPMWAKMPYLMLGKCAEALALRKAFPADLSGVYTAEEMAQADNDQQREAVFAEVEKQKAQHPISDVAATGINAAGTITSVSVIPPEHHYFTRNSGVLEAKVMDVVKKTSRAKTQFLTLQFDVELEKGKKGIAYYWHSTHRDALLAAKGRTIKALLSEKTNDKGTTFTVDVVTEIDGKYLGSSDDKEEDTKTKTSTRTTTASAVGGSSVETEARLLASTLEFDEEMLRELYSRWCKGSWPETLQKLKDEQIRREAMERNEAADALS